MSKLQSLYEKGLITYMRTDSKVISETFKENIRDYILSNFDKKFYKSRNYINNQNNVPEAHECIRPVDISIKNLDSEDSYENKLYDLIWKRTLASQMSDLSIKLYKIEIENDKNNIIFKSNLEKPIFKGFKILYSYTDTDNSNMIDLIKINNIIKNKEIISNEKYNKNILRYNEASLIKDLESKGIGRPSTYSNIIDILFKREYVEKKSTLGEEKKLKILTFKNNKIQESSRITNINKETNKIFLTDLGKIVDEFMFNIL